MNKQLSLFNESAHENNITNIFLDIANTLGYHKNIFCIKNSYSKTGKNAGKLISTSININEESYPYDAHNKIAKSTSVILFYPNTAGYEIRVTESTFNNTMCPHSAHITKNPSANYRYVHIVFEFNNNDIFSYIKRILEYALENYESSNTFGCCSRYNECSLQKKCIHANKLYAQGCQYRKNLEKGIIFY